MSETSSLSNTDSKSNNTVFITGLYFGGNILLILVAFFKKILSILFFPFLSSSILTWFPLLMVLIYLNIKFFRYNSELRRNGRNNLFDKPSLIEEYTTYTTTGNKIVEENEFNEAMTRYNKMEPYNNWLFLILFSGSSYFTYIF